MAQIRQARQVFGLGFQVKVLKPLSCALFARKRSHIFERTGAHLKEVRVDQIEGREHLVHLEPRARRQLRAILLFYLLPGVVSICHH